MAKCGKRVLRPLRLRRGATHLHQRWWLPNPRLSPHRGPVAVRQRRVLDTLHQCCFRLTLADRTISYRRPPAARPPIGGFSSESPHGGGAGDGYRDR